MTLARLQRIVTHRKRSALDPAAVDAELNRELAFHLDQLVAENVAEGMPLQSAREAARRALGNSGLIEEQCRDQRRLGWIQDLWQDLRHGARMLRLNPAFTSVAIASLALGIGANTAVLGVMNSVILEPLPFRDADRLVVLRTFPFLNPGQGTNASLPDYVAWTERTTSFESMGASLADQQNFDADEGGSEAERIAGQAVTPGLFTTLGVQPLLGRVFTDREVDIESPAAVMVISHGLWQRRFGADPGILGELVRLNARPVEIIGVMPASFHYVVDEAEYWMPLRIDRARPQGTARYFVVAGRLNDNASMKRAQAEMDNIAAQMARDFSDRDKGWGIRVQSMRDALFGWTKPVLLTLGAAVMLMLLITCANVSGLLLARGSARRPEIAMRMALGARRGRIVRQLLTESLLLASLGGALGFLIAWLAFRTVSLSTPPPGSSHLPPVPFRFSLFLATAAVSLIVGLIFGCLPALAGTRLSQFKQATSAHSTQSRWRGMLVTAQIAIALVLLAGSVVLLKSFVRLTEREFNFNPQGLVTFEYRPPIRDYLRQDGDGFIVNPSPTPAMQRILDELRRIPGATSVAGINFPPVNSLIVPRMVVAPEGHAFPADESERQAATAAYFVVTPGLLTTLQARFIRGREIDERDAPHGPWVAVINETMARRLWPGEDPLGRHFSVEGVAEDRPREVVGVIRDIPTRSAIIDPEPVLYTSYLQQPAQFRQPYGTMLGQMTFVLRSPSDPLRLIPAARFAVAKVDPRHPIARVITVQQYIGARMWDRAYYVFVLLVFAAAAVLLAAIGVYGVTSYAVAQRTREIGIRIAMGAPRRQVLYLIGRWTAVLTALGVALGTGASLALTRFIESQLWDVAPTDPATYATVSLLLILVVLAACLIPARRALRLDPAAVLRCE